VAAAATAATAELNPINHMFNAHKNIYALLHLCGKRERRKTWAWGFGHTRTPHKYMTPSHNTPHTFENQFKKRFELLRNPRKQKMAAPTAAAAASASADPTRCFYNQVAMYNAVKFNRPVLTSDLLSD
jgi:hypothetical protein